MSGNHSDGNAFLQQELGRLHEWFGVESLFHSPITQRIVKGYQTHSLVMSHERAYQHALLVLWESLGGVINRLEKTHFPHRAILSKQTKIRHRFSRAHHRREQSCIGSDYQVFDQ